MTVVNIVNELVDYGRLVDTMNWPLLNFIVSLARLALLALPGRWCWCWWHSRTGKPRQGTDHDAWHRLASLGRGGPWPWKIFEDLGRSWKPV